MKMNSKKKDKKDVLINYIIPNFTGETDQGRVQFHD